MWRHTKMCHICNLRLIFFCKIWKIWDLSIDEPRGPDQTQEEGYKKRREILTHPCLSKQKSYCKALWIDFLCHEVSSLLWHYPQLFWPLPHGHKMRRASKPIDLCKQLNQLCCLFRQFIFPSSRWCALSSLLRACCGRHLLVFHGVQGTHFKKKNTVSFE